MGNEYLVFIDGEGWEVRKLGEGYLCEAEPCDNAAGYELLASEGGWKVLCLHHLQQLVPEWVE